MAKSGPKKGALGLSKIKNEKSIIFRVHNHDHDSLKKKAKQHGFSIQTIVHACCLAFLDDDDYVIDIIKKFATKNKIKKKELSWSKSEGLRLLDAIETEFNK